jgi:hypothetical protein
VKEGQVKIWSKMTNDSEWDAESTLKFDEAVTAVDCRIVSDPSYDLLPICRLPEILIESAFSSRHLLAVGLENGHIHLLEAPVVEGVKTWTPHSILDSS